MVSNLVMDYPRFTNQAAEDETHDPRQISSPQDQVTSDTNTEVQSILTDNASETEALISQRTQTQLTRGLQVPSRGKTITRGFEYPASLAQAGVTAKDWEAFNDEIRSYARMNRKQWLETVRGTAGAILVGSLMVGFLGLGAAFLGVNMRRTRETKNIVAAKKSGTIIECITRWNTEYFFERGLAVRVDVPGEIDDLSNMDLSTSKTPLTYTPRAEIAEVVAFGDPETENSSLSDRRTTPSGHSFSSTTSGKGSDQSSRVQSRMEKAEQKSRKRDEQARKEAAQRVRIVLVPYDNSDSPERTLSKPATDQGGESSTVGEGHKVKKTPNADADEETKPVGGSKTKRGSEIRPVPKLQMGQRYL